MINLLPQQLKKSLQLESLNRHVMFFGELIFILLLLLALAMFGQELFGQWKIRELNRGISALSDLPQVKEVTQLRKQLRIFKNDIEYLGHIQDRQLRALGTLAALADLLPPTIRLSALDIDLASRKIVFSGVAPTRAELLLLKDRIQKRSSQYGDVNFPLANLLRETDIPFTLSLTIVSQGTAAE